MTTTDVNALLKAVAPEIQEPSAELLDADLARGWAALTRARRRRAFSRTAAIAATCALAVVVAIRAEPGSGPTGKAASTKPQLALAPPATETRTGAETRSGTKTNTATARPHVKLVDYTGVQLPGFNVSQVPAGWQLSTSTPYALLITPDGSTNNDPDAFVGKLAVLTSSIDQQGLGSGDPVTVDGQPGRIADQAGILILTYYTANGFGVVVQAPPTLGWDDQDLVDFAEGIQVTANAIHHVG